MASSLTSTPTPAAAATSFRIVATPPRVASRSARTPVVAESRSATRPFKGAVSEIMSASMSSSPRASMIVTPCSPIGPDTITTSPGWAFTTPRETSCSTTPIPGRVDIAAVRLALLDHLGVAGDYLHPGDPGGGLHRGHDPDQVGDREAFLQDEAGGQVERGRPRHRQVVHGAVNGQVTDVPAGKEQRGDHIRVGGERHPGAVQVQLRGIFHGLEQRIAERVQEKRPRPGSGWPCPRSRATS